MGQEQGKPIDRDSAAYKEAQQRFTTVTKAEDVVKKQTPDEIEADRLTALLDGLVVMEPMLKGSLQSHIITNKREACAAELAGPANPSAAGAGGPAAALPSLFPTTKVAATNQPIVSSPTSAGTPAAANAASDQSPAASSGLFNKGLKEAPLISLLARSQTADHRNSAELNALQEDIHSRLVNIKYNCQFLKYKASVVGNEISAFSRAIQGEEQAMNLALKEMETLSADICGLMGMIEHMGDELEAAAGEEGTADDAAAQR